MHKYNKNKTFSTFPIINMRGEDTASNQNNTGIFELNIAKLCQIKGDDYFETLLFVIIIVAEKVHSTFTKINCTFMYTTWNPFYKIKLSSSSVAVIISYSYRLKC